ncbi:dephospho-CoA kinase [Enterococcus sp. CSURQ0835]|uniref:dephospho-CoA kinase n=1 Tax=Enterococcus sp. CSURQ0835 TaxID=2681394 RepID=UPI00135A73CE|nr:dephospho-CoA kinase [Enterococcus sp. CSURQ0835]
MSFVLGITGGIASGKSTVVKCFEQAGYPIVDSDVIARQVVEPNTPGLSAIVTVFGSEILTAEGTLNRQKLGELIFNDPEKRDLLNDTLDPFIRQAIKAEIAEKKQLSELVIADVPLLYEGKYDRYTDAVAVVFVTPQVQLQRLMARNQLSEAQALARINSQLPLVEKKARADFIFDNDGPLVETQKQVLAFIQHKTWEKLA